MYVYSALRISEGHLVKMHVQILCIGHVLRTFLDVLINYAAVGFNFVGVAPLVLRLHWRLLPASLGLHYQW